jgi:hypothetical protein
MKPMQRDLFRDYVPTEAEIVMFPVERRVGLVRSVAAQLLRQTNQRNADRVWRAACWKLEGELFNRGTGESEAATVMTAFKREVEAEIARQHQQRRPA